MRAVFLSTSNALLGREGHPKGGVQICTNEYLDVLRRAGFDVSVMDFEVDRRLSNRVDKRIRRRPYKNILPPGLEQKAFAAISSIEANVVFLNLVDLAPLAKPVRKQFGDKVKIILLSHGQGCADILHEIRVGCMDTENITASARELLWLAGHLVEECDQRKYIDHVFCLSEFDVGLERWAGAHSVSWLPRIVASNPLPWSPVSERVGFVGTLDHSPNAEGLELFLRALEKRDGNQIKVRVIGGPERCGQKFACNHPNVEYLGHFNDEQLAAEAGTWMCAIHPLFCYSRGCSTKLATLLGWQIPVVSTPSGCRGYLWKEGQIPQAQTPDEFVELVLKSCNLSQAAAIQAEIKKVVASSPTVGSVADLMRNQLSQFYKL
jgi:hypothetical protein